MKKIIPIILASLFAFCSMANAASFNNQQVSDIKKIVHDYLITNPQVLVQASQALQKKEYEKSQKTTLTAVQNNRTLIFNDAMSPTFGSNNSDVTLVELFDYQCGHCKTMSKVVEQLMENNKNLKVVFKEFPIFGENSEYAAKISLAAYQLNSKNYMKLHQSLMAAANPLSKENALKLAVAAGYNQEALLTTIKKNTIEKEIDNTYDLAGALKIGFTPAFIISNKAQDQFKYIPGAAPIAQLQQAINDLSQKKS